ncbi:hypothetical protein NA57DRAFT_82025 [Rhizodiscina lignyota]|uniref:F-box domain-containing protein n=1 Tax=Rhizodiscina lignyota TaxID=1504668 RepID=A0A9P4I5W1_9PEZI|nr:hypothetical protein NA57DRAFT_82025 [Rhizodiscina lignyota]
MLTPQPTSRAAWRGWRPSRLGALALPPSFNILSSSTTVSSPIWRPAPWQQVEMRVKWVGPAFRRFSKDRQAEPCSEPLSTEPSRDASIAGLPEEILLDILLFIRHTADQWTFSNCSLTCRRWYRICFPILYSDVVLQSGTCSMEPYESAPKRDKEKLGIRVGAFTSALDTRMELIRSLTLRTASCNIDWPKWRPRIRLDRRRSERDHWFPNLCRTLPHLPNLTTFSLKVGDCGQRVLWTPHSRIIEVLDILPESVVNLEVDTMGADFATAGPSHIPSHICPSISKAIPRLRVLRIRLRFLCTDLFDCLEDIKTDSVTDTVQIPTSNLETALLVFTPRLGTVGSQSSLLQTRLCGTFDRPQNGEAYDHMSIYCHGLCASEKLPRLKSFSLIDRMADANEGHGYQVYNPMKDESNNVTYMSAFEQGLLYSEAESALFQELPVLAPSQPAPEDFIRLAMIAEAKGAWVDSSWRSRHLACFEDC